MKQYHIYGLGAALVDTEIEVQDQELSAMAVDKGLMTLVDEARQHELLSHLQGHLVHSKRACGGSACNTIIAASYFGARNYYSCKVANDDNGQFYLDDLKAAQVDSDFASVKPEGITGKCLVLITPDAERSMNTFLGISETLSEQELNADAIANSEYLYYEGYLVTSATGRAAAIKAREIAEQHQVKTAISLSDPGMVQFFKEGLIAMIGDGVDLLFCNEAEAMGWGNSNNLAEAVATLKTLAKQFVVTLGAKGALLFDGEQLIEIAGHPVTAVDSNGAGDMFAGAFLYALSQGQSFSQAGQLACRAAAEVVSHYGPRLNASQHQQLLSNHG
ncbi:adenosine kinase [Dasania marina]|uniref:adenosine kinase n=1 Tax=Dasania marina TaxID=471499 RepID=UPI000378E8B8|nr:adenosine kinase [Dasania marina]